METQRFSKSDSGTLIYEVTCVKKDERGRILGIGGQFGFRSEIEAIELIDTNQCRFYVRIPGRPASFLETYYPIPNYPFLKYLRVSGDDLMRSDLLSLPDCSYCID